MIRLVPGVKVYHRTRVFTGELPARLLNNVPGEAIQEVSIPTGVAINELPTVVSVTGMVRGGQNRKMQGK